MNNNDLASYYFHQGTNFNTYEYLGCNRVNCESDKYTYVFRTWAPGADYVGLVGDFVGWDVPYPMQRITDGGVWECVFVSDKSLEREPYKFRISGGGRVFDKGDPYARFSRGGADGASLVFTASSHKWKDKAWINRRKRIVSDAKAGYLSSPINIYEVHLGSFIRHKEDNSYYSYREIADVLPAYLKYMGYTHVEFLPLAEYPYDGSWGYQVCGFYAPTSRFGDPDDFRYMIDAFHNCGIGVILDWVPAHFPKDAWGLYMFDGTPIYEYQGEDRQESRSWGTRFFDLGREEIQSFLISNALYLLREFHIDGLRVDAVASILYLDYDKEPGSWIPNVFGNNINLEGKAFLQKLNKRVFEEFPDTLMIAEESGDFGNITHPTEKGGLGFNLKWNMGFANDFYDYVKTDPLFRKSKHTALNFPIMYAFSENYVLPISHDEVVHGKKSFIDKMYGSYEDKFLQARASLLLFMTYPGKKMHFMGTEYAQFREWDFENSLEWFMLEYEKHKSFRDYVASLNRFYLSRGELWELDFTPEGFEWLLADENEKSTVAYRRKNKKGESLIAVINFSGAEQRVSFHVQGSVLECMFDTYGGFDIKGNVLVTGSVGNYIASVTLPSFCGVVLKEKIKKQLK